MDKKYIRTDKQFKDDTFILNYWLGRSEEEKTSLIGIMARSGQPLTKEDIGNFEDVTNIVEALRTGA